MGKQRIKPNYRRRLLRLPDLDHCQAAWVSRRQLVERSAKLRSPATCLCKLSSEKSSLP